MNFEGRGAPDRRWRGSGAALVAIACIGVAACASTPGAGSPPATRYVVDASWPKPLPNKWQLGAVAGVAVDRHDHVWIIQRPATLTDDERAAAFDPPRAACCVPAPSVIEFDADGKVLRSWGMASSGFDFPKREHGIYVDPEGNVWIAGNHDLDHQVLRFTGDGKFLLQIGDTGKRLQRFTPAP